MLLQNRTLLILKYLWETSDEENTVSLADISEFLTESGIPSPDSRTLKKDIAQLIELGIDIVHDRRVQNQYHIATRHFDSPELKLLIDAVQSSRFITSKKSKELIEKLSVFAGPHQTELLQRELYVDRRAKANNENIYLIVDRIHTAISEQKKVIFQYFDYAPDKTKILRHDGQVYTVSPYALIWNNDTYYLIGFHERRNQTTKFRVDRITNLEAISERAADKPENFNVSEFFTQEFSMLGGKPCQVELLCENALMGNIIDRFGEQVHTEVVDGRHFKVITTGDLSNNFYGWVFASAGKIRILAPQEVIAGFETLMKCYQ